MSDIIEDTVTRNLEWKKSRQQRLESLRRLKAPAELIEYEEKIAEMDWAEYQVFLKEQQDDRKKLQTEYSKNNPMQQEIVDKIYNLVDNLEYDRFVYSSNLHFLMKLNPLSFMTQSDFDNCLYDAFMDHAHELYCKKYAKEYELDYGN